MSESKKLIEMFNKNFSFLQKEPIVLYGLGYRTEILINNLTGYNIVGLMDSYSSGYKAYGINVINIEEAVQLTKNIILICVYENAEIIYKNISYLENYGINIYHLNGKIMQNTNILNNNININNSIYTKKEIENMITNYDIISFDLFDTLITRKVMQISDVFLYTEEILKKYDLHIEFVENRILAEKESYKIKKDFTTINDIYDILQYRLNIDDSIKEKIKNIEIETEKQLLRKREEIEQLLLYAIDIKKEVIIVSDMYFDTNIIKDIMQSLNINFNGNIYVSSDLGMSKYNGNLWKYIKDKFYNKKILHIGDNEYSDVKQANKFNIRGIKINSCLEAYNNSTIKHNFKNIQLNLYEKLILGNFISYLFNSPFKNYTDIINITSNTDIGYLFFGPLICNFMIWLLKECKNKKINKILFISRDSYILDLLYKYIEADNIKGIYFYTSRRALSVISIFNEKDIIDNIEINYKTIINMKASFSSFLENRFGITADNEDIYKDNLLLDIKKEDLINHILNNYSKQIISNAIVERE